VPRTMIESKGGESIKGESLDDGALRDVAVSVAEALGIKGPACVQCFHDGADYLVTDVNARFGGGFPLHVAAGGGYPDLVLALARGEQPEPRLGSYRPGVIMVRYLTQVILGHDGGDALRVAADDAGLRTPPAV
jgi:carbamoyl-phosphate synthase large subunit